MNMILSRTIKLKLDISAEEILPTVKAYTEAYNLVCKVGFIEDDINGVSLHKKTYKECREKFKLPSQLACSARVKATESLKSAATLHKNGKEVSCPESKRASVRYDDRSFNINFINNEVSFSTLKGRLKSKFIVPKYFLKYLEWKRCSSELFIYKNSVYLAVVFSKHIEDARVDRPEVIGIDRGLVNLAVTSKNKFYSGTKLKKVAARYRRLRTALQKAGTKSAKRHLRKISKKENRFRADVNHCISKSIIQNTKEGSILLLENLKDIRKKVKLRKEQRRNLHNWNFHQLDTFLIYKGAEKHISIKYISPAYTSQRCSKCGFTKRSNRKSQSYFKCKECGFQLNADLNASRNIKFKFLNSMSDLERASVNKPIVSNF